MAQTTNYDFSGTADFLDNNVPLQALYDEAFNAWQSLASKRFSQKQRAEAWSALLTCLDFIDTIKERKDSTINELI